MAYMTTTSGSPTAIKLRKPFVEDGLAVWRLAQRAGGLDVNSAYSYTMWCRYFGETTVVAEREGSLVGFVTAYLVQGRPEVLFVWQIAVAPEARGVGLAVDLLTQLLGSEACARVRYIEATVTPSNVASQHLFRRLAESRGASLQIGVGLTEGQLEDGHEEEQLYRIGPL